jgi:hypothetical protein
VPATRLPHAYNVHSGVLCSQEDRSLFLILSHILPLVNAENHGHSFSTVTENYTKAALQANPAKAAAIFTGCLPG